MIGEHPNECLTHGACRTEDGNAMPAR